MTETTKTWLLNTYYSSRKDGYTLNSFPLVFFGRDVSPNHHALAERFGLFDRFFTTRGRAHGTGLGLALVKAVVVAHGGDVRAESSVGRGATFRFAVPR